MLNDPDIRAIFCARGGYGTVQIIDDINWAGFRRSPKWVVGYSDITVLHSHIQRVCNTESIHAVMPVNFNTNEITPDAISSLKKALFEGKSMYTIPNHPYNRPGIIQAPISGGNLSILYSLLGSKSEVKSRNSILFIEDLDEYLYHIDRMMMNLERNEKLRNIKGVIIFPMAGPKSEEAFIEAVFKHGITPLVGGEMTHPCYLAEDKGFIVDYAPSTMYEIAAKKGVDYFILPGNKEEALKKYHLFITSIASNPRYCMPGIGRQGGEIKKAFSILYGYPCYAIIGSAIYGSKDIRKAAKNFAKEVVEFE